MATSSYRCALCHTQQWCVDQEKETLTVPMNDRSLVRPFRSEQRFCAMAVGTLTALSEIGIHTQGPHGMRCASDLLGVTATW